MIWLGVFLGEWKGFGECCRQGGFGLWVRAILAGVMVFLRQFMRTALFLVKK